MGSSRVGSNPTRSVIFESNEFELLVQHSKRTIFSTSYHLSCDGRVVKAFDSKSNGIFPRRFESYSQRSFVFQLHYLSWKSLHCRGIEPRSPAWQARILPLNQQCSTEISTQIRRNLSILFNISKIGLHCRGIEPRSPAWQARILPLNQQCLGLLRINWWV